MAAIKYSQEHLENIRKTGRIVAAILRDLRGIVCPGITTAEIDALAAEELQRYGAKSSSLGYPASDKQYPRYPALLCTSVNDEIVHGIPSQRVLKEGDIVSIDFAANYNGWHADSAITVPVGTVSPEVHRLLEVTENALYRGIAVARAGNRLRDIGRTVQQYVEAAGFSVVRQYGGHGVGRSMHEDPQVFNYIEPTYPNYALKPGMVIAIEPMVNMGAKETKVLSDGWTVVTNDGSYSAHFEHTVAITDGEADILTL
jgi:methionyl aminopeptidase